MALSTNQNLEELFDLPASESDADDLAQSDENTGQLPVLPESLDALDKIEAALPAVRGLEASDEEIDELAKKATESFDDLITLGMQVDSRYASEIFSVASSMLGHAITAKTAKMNKKLKMIDLQMRKLKLDREEKSPDQDLPTARGQILDRNELLKALKGRSDDTDSEKS